MTSAPDPVPSLAADTVIDLERQYLLQNYSRYPLVVHRGKGCHVYDVNGTRYLDFIAGIGVNALGHAHPRIVKVIREQAALLIHSSNLYYHEYQGPLAKKLAETSGLQRTFFTNSGSEAMEGALKMIRSQGNKHGTGYLRLGGDLCLDHPCLHGIGRHRDAGLRRHLHDPGDPGRQRQLLRGHTGEPELPGDASEPDDHLRDTRESALRHAAIPG